MTPDAKIQPAITGRARKTVAYDFSRHGHALVTLYVQFLPMLISQNLTAEFMRKVYADLETCLPMVEADRVLFRHLVMFLTVFFHWMYKMKYRRYQDSSVLHGWFVYWDFGWEMRRLSKSSGIRIKWHSFRFSPCLISKRVEKSQAILVLLDDFQELHLDR